jgi:hypothetical protein
MLRKRLTKLNVNDRNIHIWKGYENSEKNLQTFLNETIKVVNNYKNYDSTTNTVRSKIKKNRDGHDMINTLQLIARKNLIQMSLQW